MKEPYLAAEPMECLGSGEEVWRGVRAINPIEAIEKHNGSVRKLLPLKLRNMLTQRAPYRSAFKKGIDWCDHATARAGSPHAPTDMCKMLTDNVLSFILSS